MTLDELATLETLDDLAPNVAELARRATFAVDRAERTGTRRHRAYATECLVDLQRAATDAGLVLHKVV